jgi:hypothetical protein
MLDDNPPKAMPPVCEFDHHPTLTATILPGHPVILTKQTRNEG